MSDNIDYAELDKAVNEAMQAQSSHRPIAPAKKSTTHQPIARPQSRGRFMDFAPRGASMTITTPIKTTPAQKQPTTPKTTVRPATRRIVQHPSAAPSAPKQTIPKTTSRIPTIRKASENTPRTPLASAPRPSVAAKIQQKQERLATTVTKPTPKSKANQRPEAPDANSYSLGGRSPFLVDTKVEKRPLGNNIPETSMTAVRSTKNIYSQKNPAKAPVTKRKKHTVTEAPKSHSGWLWSLVVLLVIAAGAGLGYLAYLIVFAN